MIVGDLLEFAGLLNRQRSAIEKFYEVDVWIFICTAWMVMLPSYIGLTGLEGEMHPLQHKWSGPVFDLTISHDCHMIGNICDL